MLFNIKLIDYSFALTKLVFSPKVVHGLRPAIENTAQNCCGFAPTTLLRFFSFFTFRSDELWLALAAFALWRLLLIISPSGNRELGLTGFWGGLYFPRLTWFFKARPAWYLMSWVFQKLDNRKN